MANTNTIRMVTIDIPLMANTNILHIANIDTSKFANTDIYSLKHIDTPQLANRQKPQMANTYTPQHKQTSSNGQHRMSQMASTSNGEQTPQLVNKDITSNGKQLKW